MEKEMLDWITQLIRENDVHRYCVKTIMSAKGVKGKGLS